MVRSIGCAPILLALVAVCMCPPISADPARAPDEIILEHEQILVTVENGTPFSIMVEPDDTVQDLRATIMKTEGLLFERIVPKLDEPLSTIFNSKLSSLNIRAGHTLGLVERKNGSLNVIDFVVKTLDGNELPMTTRLGSTVANLKKNITQLSGIPEAQQRLLLRGKELKDERSLFLYGINNGTILRLGRPLEDCSKTARIYVKVLSGTTIELEVDLANTVTNLKEKIWEKTGVPVGAQHLYASRPAKLIAGEDHLCDHLGLESNSTVYMLLYSSRVTSPGQVERLREQPAAQVAIFREVEEPSRLEKNGRYSSIFKNSRNWFARTGRRPDTVTSLFDPIAYLQPNPDDEKWMQQSLETLERYLQSSDVHDLERSECELKLAQQRIASAVLPYRRAANLTSSSITPEYPPMMVPYTGIVLGGGSTGLSSSVVSLGADVNNWAPDAFSDSDLMRLFEVSERVREVLASDARTGLGTLSYARQRRINRAILFAYSQALAGYPPSRDHNQPEEHEECAICRDNLVAEPSVKLTCEHTFHYDCILSWIMRQYEKRDSRCPYCRRVTMLPYEKIGKIELDSPELRSGHDE